jgi:hypothetical protein
MLDFRGSITWYHFTTPQNSNLQVSKNFENIVSDQKMRVYDPLIFQNKFEKQMNMNSVTKGLKDKWHY